MTQRSYDPDLTRAHLSNRFFSGLVHYFSREFGEETIAAIVEAAGLSLAYLSDETRWTSVEFDRRFCDAAARHIAGLDTAPDYHHSLWQHWRRASATMFSRREAMGPLWLLLWSFERPSRLFAEIGNLYTRGNQVTSMELVEQRPGAAVIRARMREPYRVDRPGTCWSRRGVFEAIPTLWGLPPARVEHTRCIHQDRAVDHCVYEVHHEDERAREPDEELTRLRAQIRRIIPTFLESVDRQYTEHRESQLAERKTALYLPSQLVEAIRINPENELVLGGQRTAGAVLIADIKDFTRRCQTTGADAVLAQLNLYYARFDALIARHGGIVDKRMGDGVMVVFISPERTAELADLGAAAVRSGLDLLAALPAIGDELRALGAAPFQVRIGVAVGPLVQGNLGSPSRMEYTVIGDTVNVAARLESAASPDHLLALPQCLARVDPALYERVDTRVVRAKGLGLVEAVELRPRFAG